jgi:hypothetical protein
MRQVRFSQEQFKKEHKEKEAKKAEYERRANYFERLKSDRNFQKYIVEEIIKRNIAEMTDLKVLEREMGKLSREDVGELVFISTRAANRLEKIFREIEA